MDGRGEDAYKEAQEYIRRGMEEQKRLEAGGEEALGPYQRAGAGAIGDFQGALAQGRDPGEFINQLMGQYRESPEFKARLNAALEAANRAAAASGMLGSSEAQQQAAQTAVGMREQDIQDFLRNALGIRGQYLAGQQFLGGLGQKSAEDILRARLGLGQELGAGYGGLGRAAIGAARERQGRLGGLGGLLGRGLGAAGGFLFGGPGGAAAGAGLGGSLFGGNQGGPSGGIWQNPDVIDKYRQIGIQL